MSKRRIRKLADLHLGSTLVLGVSFKYTRSTKDGPTQWRSFYFGFLVWELEVTIAWEPEERKYADTN